MKELLTTLNKKLSSIDLVEEFEDAVAPFEEFVKNITKETLSSFVIEILNNAENTVGTINKSFINKDTLLLTKSKGFQLVVRKIKQTEFIIVNSKNILISPITDKKLKKYRGERQADIPPLSIKEIESLPLKAQDIVVLYGGVDGVSLVDDLEGWFICLESTPVIPIKGVFNTKSGLPMNLVCNDIAHDRDLAILKCIESLLEEQVGFTKKLEDSLVSLSLSNMFQVRWEAVRILGLVNEESCIKRLKEMTRDPNPHVKSLAVSSLEELKSA